jgi:hypothetical protein
MTLSVAGAGSLFTIRRSEEPRRDPKWPLLLGTVAGLLTKGANCKVDGHIAQLRGHRAGQLLSRLRCAKCRGKSAAVFLCAGQRRSTGGPPPDWAIELASSEGQGA